MSPGSLPRFFLLICAWFTLAPSPACAFQSYFMNTAVRDDSLQMFPKWTGMLSRFEAESRTLDSVCFGEENRACRLKDWKDFLISQRDRPLDQQLENINRYVNKYTYIEDILNWGVGDYWETPYEFQRKNGDCEDFAIAKYMSLRALGLSGDGMRVAIVRDMNLGGIIHAVLLVDNGDETDVLDNQIKQVLPAEKIYHYVPVYSINEDHWWQYAPPS